MSHELRHYVLSSKPLFLWNRELRERNRLESPLSYIILIGIKEIDKKKVISLFQEQKGVIIIISLNETTEENEIQYLIHTALYKALSNFLLCEPQLVANLTHQIPLQLNQHNNNNNSTIKLNIGGIFVHQTPKVRFCINDEGGKATTEIGDLLLISHEILGNNTTHRALLLQAKKVNKRRDFIKPDNYNQWKLYNAWPEFEYSRSGQALNGKKRHINFNDIYTGTRYLLLSDYPRSYYPRQLYLRLARYPHLSYGLSLLADPTRPELTHHDLLCMVLYDFILGRLGKEFKIVKDYDPKNSDGLNDWDKVINDLIHETANKLNRQMGKASSFSGKSSRGEGNYGLNLLAQNFICGEFNNNSCFCDFGKDSYGVLRLDEDQEPPQIPPKSQEHEYGNEEESGISIIEFTISKEEGSPSFLE